MGERRRYSVMDNICSSGNKLKKQLKVASTVTVTAFSAFAFTACPASAAAAVKVSSPDVRIGGGGPAHVYDKHGKIPPGHLKKAAVSTVLQASAADTHG